MKKVYGITSYPLQSFERGLWPDHDEKGYRPRSWGFKIDLVIGKMIRPIPKFWKPGFWRGEDEYNPWKGGKFWFILRIPFMLGFFISMSAGRFGMYFGCKTFEVAPRHQSWARYGRWLRPEEVGTDEEPAVYLQLSATTRRTRWK